MSATLRGKAAGPSGCVELAAASNFSFLRGASHPEEMVMEAARLGLSGIAIADRNTLAGVVRGHMAAKEAGIAYAPGCRLVFCDTTPDIFAWPRDRAGYANLCELLTAGKRRAPKGECHLTLDDLLRHGAGLLMAAMWRGRGTEARAPASLRQLRDAFPGQLHLGLVRAFGPGDRRRMAAVERCAEQLRVPVVALGDVLYHVPQRRALQDVLTCIRERETLAGIGRRLEPNAERHLRSAPGARPCLQGA